MQLKKKPYVIDGVIGNSKMLATLSGSGELHRLWWPQIGYPQHINEFVFGLYMKNFADEIVWLNDSSWHHTQSYIENTNVLVTVSTHDEFPIKVTVTDFSTPHGDSLVREIKLATDHTTAIDVELYAAASFAIAENTRYNAVLFDHAQDALVFYRHEYAFAVGSSLRCSAFEAGKQRKTHFDTDMMDDNLDGHEVAASVDERTLNGNEIAMAMSGMLKWNVSILAQSEISVPIVISAGHGIEAALREFASVSSVHSDRLKGEAVDYWHHFVEGGRKLTSNNEAVQSLYNRSILTFKLMSDKTYGSLIAAPEFDEDFTRCGGYSYCWGRDAAYITTAIDQAGYHEMVDQFYDWTVKAQHGDGSWQQRHFMDGTLAPQWGLQIDETGSILWGMWQHYLETKKRYFAEKVWTSVQKGADFLSAFIDPETKMPLQSRDLWEERDGQHIYSAAAVYGGLIAAHQFALLLNKEEQSERWRAVAESIKDAVLTIGWSEEKDQFLRVIKMEVTKEQYEELTKAGARTLTEPKEKGYTRFMAWKDDIVDISLLGLSEPFRLIEHTDPKMVAMVKAIEEKLVSPKVGGIKRYENDHYIGGNPWILTTLWLASYFTKTKQFDKALPYFQWALDHQTELGLLPEQIDKETGKTAWVVPLTWSHAMFVLAAVALDEAGVL